MHSCILATRARVRADSSLAGGRGPSNLASLSPRADSGVTGPEAIDRYKVLGKYGWSLIFARVLVGYLNLGTWFRDYDLIVPSPTYVGDGGRSFDHTGLVIERAMIEDDSWLFETDAIVKTKATRRFRGHGWSTRKIIAETELRPALDVPRPELVEAKKILVYDDVFTEGLTIREVARALKLAGAASVSEAASAQSQVKGRSLPFHAKAKSSAWLQPGLGRHQEDRSEQQDAHQGADPAL